MMHVLNNVLMNRMEIPTSLPPELIVSAKFKPDIADIEFGDIGEISGIQ